MARKREFGHVKRIVIKVGTSSLTHKTGKLNLGQMEKLVREMADLYNEGRELLLVTSGAVGAGMGRLGWKTRPKTIPEKQACAAVGQGLLLQVYENFFSQYGITVGQVLLTRDDFADRRRFLNARNTLLTLLRLGILPIINENDTVAVDEIRFGDNDTLSALVTNLIDAEMLLILSDVDGLYTADPRKDPAARFIPEVEKITPELEAVAGGAGSATGSGGMVTKFQAAQIVGQAGAVMVIAAAAADNVLRRVLAGEEIGTVFWPAERHLKGRKRWILFGTTVQGKIYVDEGAARALCEDGRSLLPSGIVGVEGDFEAGHAVSIIAPGGREIARGLVNYAAAEVDRMKGLKTREIAALMGQQPYDEVVHRDNLVLT
ncbi:glutamate 5-kinase [Thermodesulfitimonas autotrophica]|uniref:Glutamate 5-kinase n=1 Tax=Thermodesulfitimonas autotrophica TaxID=1894989 RepID=A0A3N5BGD8_9THEO|nr:glutamate 5-kinase [Thermodesulfitimonas autotrophica]RPF47132.1 glutamate 5-kinase [Thermodesulfitimonas autotrophica]